MKKIKKRSFHKDSKKKEIEDKKKAGNNLHKLEHAVLRSSTVVYQLTTVFPFYIFPVTIVIDEEKVSIIYSNFFYSKQVVQILLKDINSIQLESDVFFAKMQFNNAEPISFLWKDKAFRARRIIEGLIILASESVDTSLLSIEEVRKKAEELGKTKEVK
ncbi:MAG: hypothetical protein HYW86_03395 [Candidatus Roizmanbacteria bacterium]|nr:MAG: hypothetical protein HYW86_03395 [Candidatus Roizmanbacteria bacterium]